MRREMTVQIEELPTTDFKDRLNSALDELAAALVRVALEGSGAERAEEALVQPAGQMSAIRRRQDSAA